MYPTSGLPSFEPEEALPVRCVRDGSDAVTPPSVTTSAASNVNPTSATLNGTVNGSSITAQGFEWKATTSSTYSQVTASGTTMTYGLSNLTANTSYKYRAFVTSVAGTKYGAEKTFTTPTKPSVSTGTADPVGETTATLNASITNPDGVNITAKGFEYTSDGTNWSPVAGTGEGNSFTADLTGLDAGTEYTYKAFITFDNQTVFGDDETFTTNQISVITPPTANVVWTPIGGNKVRITLSNINLQGQTSGTVKIYYSWAHNASYQWTNCEEAVINEDPFVIVITLPYEDNWDIKVELNNGAINDSYIQRCDVY